MEWEREREIMALDGWDEMGERTDGWWQCAIGFHCQRQSEIVYWGPTHETPALFFFLLLLLPFSRSASFIVLFIKLGGHLPLSLSLCRLSGAKFPICFTSYGDWRTLRFFFLFLFSVKKKKVRFVAQSSVCCCPQLCVCLVFSNRRHFDLVWLRRRSTPFYWSVNSTISFFVKLFPFSFGLLLCWISNYLLCSPSVYVPTL